MGNILNIPSITFNRHQPLTLNTDWVEDWTSREWLTGQPHPLHKPAGLLKGYSLAQLTGTQTGEILQKAFRQLHGVLQPSLQHRAAVVAQAYGGDTWEVFTGEFRWVDTHGSLTPDSICMPYHKPSVAGTQYIYTNKQHAYLRVLVGRNELGREIFEYAHRLVCLAFNGGPRLATAQPHAPHDWRLVVNHMCSNPSCLNPRHLQWVTLQQNTHFVGYGVGKVG